VDYTINRSIKVVENGMPFVSLSTVSYSPSIVGLTVAVFSHFGDIQC